MPSVPKQLAILGMVPVLGASVLASAFSKFGISVLICAGALMKPEESVHNTFDVPRDVCAFFRIVCATKSIFFFKSTHRFFVSDYDILGFAYGT